MTDTASRVTKASWHLDKTISVGHLLTTVVIAVSAMSWASALDRRIEQNSSAIKYMTSEQDEIKREVDSVRKEIRDDLQNISKKLDRLVERGMRRE